MILIWNIMGHRVEKTTVVYGMCSNVYEVAGYIMRIERCVQ